jgi:hypothetical protein
MLNCTRALTILPIRTTSAIISVTLRFYIRSYQDSFSTKVKFDALLICIQEQFDVIMTTITSGSTNTRLSITAMECFSILLTWSIQSQSRETPFPTAVRRGKSRVC